MAQFSYDRRRFAVVVLHELAHHRNGDVGKTFAALAVWWAFVVAAVGPYALVQLLRLARADDLALWLWGNLRLLFIPAIVYLTRNALLRARELYADTRVAQWVPAADVLEAIREVNPGGAESRRRPAVAGVLAVHPAWQRRRRALEHPSSLLQASGWDVFGTGMAAAVVILMSLGINTMAIMLLIGPVGLEQGGPVLDFVPVILAFVPAR